MDIDKLLKILMIIRQVSEYDTVGGDVILNESINRFRLFRSLFLAGRTLFDPHIPIMLFACGFVGKLLNKIQCIHVFFHARIDSDYAKICRGV